MLVWLIPLNFPHQVKYRIAVGLSKEGRAITRNFITLVIMTSLGIVFFNHMLKEFCIIALAGLVCDTFLQLLFFPAVLSIDLRRLEVGFFGGGDLYRAVGLCGVWCVQLVLCMC